MRITVVFGTLAVASCSLLMIGAVAAQQATGNAAIAAVAGRVVRPAILTHVVADLPRSIAFFRQGMGFEVASGPAPLVDSPLVHQAMSVSGSAKATAATLAIPGSNFQLRLVQFSGISGTPFTQRLYDPGVSRFSIQVRDIDKAFERVKELGVTVDTTSAGPVFTQRPRNNTRAVMMRDPDGFVFEFVQAGEMPQTDVPATSNIYNARSSLALDNMEKSLAFYRDLLGFAVTNQPADINDAVLALEGTPRARARTVASMPPGSNNMWVLWEFRDIERTKRVPAPQDPGASVVSFDVEHLDALLARVAAAGVMIETPGAQAVRFSNGRRGALVRSPDGMLIELLE
jgi:catechol 2,3-dioxygenase-like lactoylglutathione lyase family enzyme